MRASASLSFILTKRRGACDARPDQCIPKIAAKGCYAMNVWDCSTEPKNMAMSPANLSCSRDRAAHRPEVQHWEEVSLQICCKKADLGVRNQTA